MFKKFEKNLHGRDLIVSDLHGCYKDFQKELKWTNFDPEIDRMFSVGDLVDRGPDSVSCLSLLEEDWFHAVKGNHEILWLKAHKFYHQDFDEAYDNILNLSTDCQIFLRNGGELVEDPKIYLKYKKLIQELPSIIEFNHRFVGKVGILHAELPFKFTDWNALYEMADEEIEKSLGESLYWGRTRISSKRLIHDPIENVDRIYVGHTIVDDVTNLGNIRYIDTGAFNIDGRLTVEIIK